MQNDEPILLRTIPEPIQPVTNVNDELVDIVRTGNSMTANIKNLNIRITATLYQFSIYLYINYQICVPRFLCELSFGHLGNCDDDLSNDVSGPNDCESLLHSCMIQCNQCFQSANCCFTV